MTLTDEQRMAILDEIIAVTRLPQRKPYQFTRKEYQERAGVTQWRAENTLDESVEAGTLLREKHKNKWVYWRPEDEPQ